MNGNWQKELKDKFFKELEEAKESDVINSPSHYANGDIECIDAIEEVTKDLQGMEAVCTANVMRYIWRWKNKNGVEDLKKARWYLNRLIDDLES